MSGIAAAKKRRAGVTTPTPMPTPDVPRLPNGGLATPPQQKAQGLTLQQVIALFDSRINKVEKAINEGIQTNQPFDNSREMEALPTNITEILDDFQQKFVILAGEINSLKDTVLKLQTYTMEVNKVLLEDRIQILSDIGENDDDRFLLENQKSETNTDNSISNENFNSFTFDTIESNENNSF